MQEVHRKLDDISRKSYDDETFDDDDDDGDGDDDDDDDDDDGEDDDGGDGDDGAYDNESDRYSSDSVDVESAAATSTHLPRDCSTLLGCAACGDIRRATEMMNDQPASFAIEIDQRDSQVSPQNQT
jgi:cobalamin biosynthesis protein CobT